MGNNSNHSTSKATRERQKAERLGEERYNNQGCLMKVVEYEKTESIVVEFQDKYKGRVVARYNEFAKGKIKNPYHPNVYGGMIGSKYPAKVNGKISKEYFTWKNMLVDCADNTQETTCCKEWLLFENFYEWLHKQENFERFIIGDRWKLNNSIIVKDSKVYSPETCCLIPPNIKKLIEKQKLNIGQVSEKILKEYKEYKKNIIEQVAKEELEKRNITEECYNALMSYEMEITDYIE